MFITFRTQEVAVQGKKLGVTKKGSSSHNNLVCISKYKLYTQFIDILNLDFKIKERIVGDNDMLSIPYNTMKWKSKKYFENWSLVKEKVFKTWTVKPDIWNFCLDAT